MYMYVNYNQYTFANSSDTADLLLSNNVTLTARVGYNTGEALLLILTR